MGPDTWIIKCLKMDKISNKVIIFISKFMKSWKVKLAAGGPTLEEVKIPRGIFQENWLLLLLFVIAMMPLNYIVWKWTLQGATNLQEKKLKEVFFRKTHSCCLLSQWCHSITYIERFSKVQKKKKKIIHFLFVDDIKVFFKKWIKTGNPDEKNKNIHPVYRNGIKHWKMYHAYNEK